MEQFLPPPAFTTVRFDPEVIDRTKAKQELYEQIQRDLYYRQVPKVHHPLTFEIEFHPLIPDMMLVPVKKLINVTPHSKEVVVDRSCGNAVLRGAHVFAPGVIAASPAMHEGDFVSVYVDLEGKCLRGLTSVYQGPKVFIGNGTAEFSREAFFAHNVKLTGVGVRMHEPNYLTPCLHQGSLPPSCFLQNLPSIVVGHALDPQPNSIILDMCAAPGGKSTHLCSLLRGSGHVIALDRSKNKIEKIKTNAETLGYSKLLSAFAVDSRKIVLESDKEKMGQNYLPPYPPESFNYILLDAPCSALGQRPQFCTKKADVTSYPALQWQLFLTAVKLLKVRGTLVYSTCTTTYEENEGMVEKALEHFPNLRLAPQKFHIGETGRKMGSGLTQEQLNLLQFFPMTPHNREVFHPADKETIGFFIAKFTKF